jgi:hypothetical protein
MGEGVVFDFVSAPAEQPAGLFVDGRPVKKIALLVVGGGLTDGTVLGWPARHRRPDAEARLISRVQPI